jgi:enoyl-CoA hydratase
MRELFPRGHSRHAFYTGEYISAEEAYRVGAAYSLHEPEDLMDAAMTLAKTIASKSPSMMRMFKDTVRWTEYLDMETGYRFEGERWYAAKRDPLAAAEMVEAKQSFFEKRPARFDEVRKPFLRGEGEEMSSS